MDYFKLFVVVVVVVIPVVNLKIHVPHAYSKLVLHDGVLRWKPSFKNFITDTIT
jgi:hypothetical protein